MFQRRKKINVMLIGRNGRESALAWKLAQSPKVERVYVAPGNGGTAFTHPKVKNVEGVEEIEIHDLASLAVDLEVCLVIPGAEMPIIKGLGNIFGARGIYCLAPNTAAAELEGSKAFAKDFMKRNAIPTAEYEVYDNYKAACERVRKFTPTDKIVIKGSGPTNGRGTVIPTTPEEGVRALWKMMVAMRHGSEHCRQVIIERFIEGEVLTILAFSDGERFRQLPPARVYDRAFDGDEGLNTAGMGCIAPVRRDAATRTVQKLILERTLRGLRKTKSPIPILLSYNVRPTDPATQALIPLLDETTDLYDVFMACIHGELARVHLGVDESKTSVVVVAAAEGFPKKIAFHADEVTGHAEAINPEFKNTLYKGVPTWVPKDAGWGEEGKRMLNYFHCATRYTPLDEGGENDERRLLVAGARVVSVVGTGASLEEATQMAYMGMEAVRFQGMWFRKDLGCRTKTRTVSTGSNSTTTMTTTATTTTSKRRRMHRFKDGVKKLFRLAR